MPIHEGGPLLLRKIAIRNVRCFENLTLDLDAGKKPRMWAVILGDNGVGKTTLLRCIAMGLAALDQGIPVIAVRENKNLMCNDLSLLPWSDGQLTVVENYWEAAGVIAAMRAGIAPKSVRRPLPSAPTSALGRDIDLARVRSSEPLGSA